MTIPGVSPDRLPAAGVRTMTSIGDKRLIQPSDNSDYLKSPEKNGARYIYYVSVLYVCERPRNNY